jgi:hypothetical protein
MEEDLVPYVSKVGLDLAMHWWLLTNINIQQSNLRFSKFTNSKHNHSKIQKA